MCSRRISSWIFVIDLQHGSAKLHVQCWSGTGTHRLLQNHSRKPGNTMKNRLIICAGALGFLCTAVNGELITENQPQPRVAPVAPPKAAPFSLHDVRLLDGPFKQAQDIAVNYLLSLDPDRLLARYRMEAGLEPKAPSYGGWEAQGIAGHSLGHYLSGCSLAYASTGDKRFLDRVNYIVDELAECQRAQVVCRAA
jgi:hypothetical protein